MEYPTPEGVTESRLDPDAPEGVKIYDTTTGESKMFAWSNPEADRYLDQLMNKGRGFHVTPLLYNPEEV